LFDPAVFAARRGAGRSDVRSCGDELAGRPFSGGEACPRPGGIHARGACWQRARCILQRSDRAGPRLPRRDVVSGSTSLAVSAGYLGDSIVQRRKDGRMLCAAIAALMAVPFSCIAILRPAGSLLSAIVFLVLTYAALTSYYGFVYSAIQDIVAPNQRGTAMAIYFMAMYLCGASFGPLLTGRLSDLLAHRAAALAGSPVVRETFRAVGLQ